MIRVGIIGCGGIAYVAHLAAYIGNKDAEVVALCDINEAKFARFEAKLGKKKTYTDFKEMIDNEKLDMVDICTPNYLHADMAIYAMKKGLDVFCEKPDTISVEKALEMQAVQKEEGRHLMVMRNNRYAYSSQQLKKMISDGGFGDVYAGRCGWIRRRGIPGKGGWFTTKALSGGGPLIDLGVHMIDLAIYLMGNPKAVSVSGSTYNKFAAADESQDSVHSSFGEAVEGGTCDVEDLAIGFIKFENGASLQIEFSWASNIEKEVNFVELRGSRLGAKWENGFYTLYDGKPVNKLKAALSKANQAAHSKLIHKENLLHFFDVVEGRAKPDFVMEQGVDMIKILCAFYESAKTGREIILKNYL